MSESYSASIANSTSAADALGTETASATGADGRSRITWSADSFGRGVSVTITPLDATSQNVLHAVAFDVIPSLAGPEDE